MKNRKPLIRILLAVLLVGVAGVLAFHRNRLDPALIEQAIGELGPWAPIVHILLYAVATLLFVPGTLPSLVGGALFGPFWGTIFNLIGATLGATASFLTARYFAADWVRRWSGLRLQKLLAGVDEEGWRFVAFTRLVPLFPFNLLNYALGLTRIPLSHYILASLICMAPGTLAFTWLAYAGREALAGDERAVRYGLFALALLAGIAFLPRILRRLRKPNAVGWIDITQLSLATGPDGPAIIDVRGADEFAGPLGHITGARNLPVGELQGRLQELMALKDRPVVLVCRTDKRSANAALILRHAGFRDVRVLRGGMEEWRKKPSNP